ncbi:MAG: hypothetical protein ACI8XX_001535 [Polaribacter sp.]
MNYVASRYNVKIIGRSNKINEQYYAIYPERKIKHLAILEIIYLKNNPDQRIKLNSKYIASRTATQITMLPAG